MIRIEIQNDGKRIEVEDLTPVGLQEAIYSCERLIETLREQVDKEGGEVSSDEE